MRLVQLIMLLSAALLPLPAAAIDVDLGARVEAVYDSNVFRTNEDEKQDGSFRFTPTIRIEGANSKFSGNIAYEPTYEVFTTYSEANDLTHMLSNGFDWQPSEKTDLTWVNSFQAVDVLNFGNPDTIDEGTEVIPSNDIARERIYLFGSGLSVAHTISPRWDSTSDLTYNLFEPKDRANSVASNSVSGFQTFSYGLTAADSLGAGGGITAQFFDEVQTLPANNTFVYQLFATYVRNFGESTTLSLRIGPAAIQTIQDSGSGTTIQTYSAIQDGSNFKVSDPDKCVRNVQAGPADPVLFEGSRCKRDKLITPADGQAYTDLLTMSETDIKISGSNEGANDLKWTVFGEVALTHLWLPTLATTLSYNRSENTANGEGGSAIADTVLLSTTWRPSELWDLSVRASYVRRDSPTDLSRTFYEVEVDPVTDLVFYNGSALVVADSENINTHRWAVVARAARRISRRLTASARVSYSDQRAAHTGRSPNDFGDFLAVVGIQYDFDPFRF